MFHICIYSGITVSTYSQLSFQAKRKEKACFIRATTQKDPKSHDLEVAYSKLFFVHSVSRSLFHRSDDEG